MTKCSLLEGVCLVLFMFILTVKSAPFQDLIVSLPGQNSSVTFKQYSGYLNGDQGVKLHYWFVQSSNNASTDPVVLWLNGGPGCSSLDGLLNELGPFLLNNDGKSFRYNKYSWNTVANVLFLESPACVGFSYNVSGICKNSDNSTALNNYYALQDFFKKFPEYRANEFFITGESYAGVYVPTLSMKVLEGMKDFHMNFKGYAIGNGLGSYQMNSDSLIFFAYYHGLLGNRLWMTLTDHCCRNGIIGEVSCNFYNSPYPMCLTAVQDALNMIYETGINMYNMYADCIPPINKSRYHMDLKNIFHGHPSISINTQKIIQRQENNIEMDPPCTDGTAMRAYLNRKDVRKALHIPKGVASWDICNDEVNSNYVRDYTTTLPLHKKLIKQVKGLLYNGDVDMACNFLGDEWLTDNLELPIIEKRRPWYENHQVGGFVKRFENMTYTTIRGSGHMVPQDKPGPALKMIVSFLFDKPY